MCDRINLPGLAPLGFKSYVPGSFCEIGLVQLVMLPAGKLQFAVKIEN